MLHFASTLTHRIAQQKFATRHQLGMLDIAVDRALIGDRKLAQLFELITKEFKPQRMLVVGSEHVENATPHSELPAPGHHVDTGICQSNKSLRKRRQVVVAATLGEHNGFDSDEVVGNGLQRCPHRRHQHKLANRILSPLSEVTQSLHSLAHGFGTGAQSLVRQSLPCRKLHDLGTREVTCQRPAQRFRLTPGSGDSEHRSRRICRGEQTTDEGRT